jgi:hypothetical protein
MHGAFIGFSLKGRQTVHFCDMSAELAFFRLLPPAHETGTKGKVKLAVSLMPDTPVSE